MDMSTDGPREAHEAADSGAAQPVGELIDFTPPARPDGRTLRGDRVALRLFDDAQDAEPMFRASHAPDGDPRIWTYLYEEPSPDLAAYRAMRAAQIADPAYVFYAIVPRATGVAAGQISYMTIVPEHGTIELGNIWLAPSLQRTAAATEAIYLAARHAFDDLGYRRLEWKCNALNAPSRAAALRFGFAFEGIFAQHRVVKGRNRDTAWFAITDRRWPLVRAAFEAWLDAANFDADGRQRQPLAAIRAGLESRG